MVDLHQPAVTDDLHVLTGKSDPDLVLREANLIVPFAATRRSPQAASTRQDPPSAQRPVVLVRCGQV